MAVDRPTVLITGMGGPLGVSVFKALRQSALSVRVIGTDAEPLAVGLFRTDAAYLLPRITGDGIAYRERLAEVCIAEQVAMVCFGSDIEMRRMAQEAAAFEALTGTRLVLDDAALIDIFFDKWETIRLLERHGLPVPDSVLVSDAAAVEGFLASHPFPVVLKPRIGSGSRDVVVVHDATSLQARIERSPDSVLQEYLVPDDQEYTVGAYKSPRTGYVGQLAMRRSLVAGLTYRAQVVNDLEIEAVCRAVVETFDLWGPINIQLRKTPAGVRIFEINPRFSSTTVIRAHFGFNEPEMCLRELVLGETLAPPTIRSGYALRFWDELYLEPDEVVDGMPVTNGSAAVRRSDAARPTAHGQRLDVF